jgi:hypothetical protein
MKQFISLGAIVSFILVLQLGLAACSKDKTIYKTDTVVIKDTAISLELLTSKSWKLEEILGVQGNAIIYYKRGGNSNTANYSNDYITFNANKTGIYVDAAAASHSITWDFINNDISKLMLIIANPAPLASQTVVYENMRYKNGALLFDQYWTYNNINAHFQVIRTPR